MYLAISPIPHTTMETCTKVDFSKDEAIEALVESIRLEHGLFTMSTEQLVKTFLTKVLCIDCFTKTFDLVRDTYITDSKKEGKDKDDVPNEVDKFYAFVLQRHFGYWQEPKLVLAEYYDRAIKDWNEVENRIKVLKEEIVEIKRVNNPTTNQKRLPIAFFYLKHTEIALEDITTFLKKEIHKFVLRRCKYPKNSITWDVYPYHYYFSASAYDIKEPTMISNKFTRADSDKRKEFIDAYENRRQEFDEFLRKYIEDNDVLLAIRYSCETNYFFNKRREFIKEALEVYERGNYLLFSSACFLIVEGILHDICLCFAKDKSSVLGFAFQKKLDMIYEVYKIDIDYQYYSFMFRLLRNEVAHGTANPEMLRENADLLLLDLLDIIEVSKSNRILLNPKSLAPQAGSERASVCGRGKSVSFQLLWQSLALISEPTRQ
ncbi:MAG: hypothetical protein EOP45_08480 [Sphingobacteriaceae bacterium]|nr:MAG: hypothetical protein EOP45_08480 [Sphingobacteriaceae bacterium]